MAARKPPEPPRDEKIIQRAMEEVMHDSMMPYSEYVILERALPRVEDGLKPVQRRILYTMSELSLTPDKPHRKCARIVGDCLGKYHPHGDTSVYDALARMAQPFVMRGMLVNGHGNFGSVDGDSPAAMRYTEAKMTELAMELLRDIDKDTVSFRLNFDDTQKEPDMLPGRFPNLLVNGASGIAVGVATNIPPHNLGEAIDAVTLLIDEPDAPLPDIMRVMPAPDFPTGGILLVDDELTRAYETGRGKLTLRAKVATEHSSAGRTLIVITEIPYQVSKSAMLEKILKLSEEKKAIFSGIYDIRDESDRTGMRAVIELRKDADVQQTLAALYKYSDLQVTYGVNNVAIAGGKPVQMGIRVMIGHYIRHQKNVVTRRTRYELEQAKRRLHILEGLIIAVDNLDEVIRLIRASKTPKEARDKLMERFQLTEIQAQAILDMRLQRLTNLEVLALRNEHAELIKLVDHLTAILNSEKKLLALIKKELGEVRAKYADARRTEIISKPTEEVEIAAEKPIEEETTIVVTRAGFVKRMPPKVYERALAADEQTEAPRGVFEVMTGDKLLFFTSAGFCYPITASQVPECKLKDRGLPLNGLLPGFENDESLTSILRAPDGERDGDLIFVTAGGQVKRTAASEYDVRGKRFAAINLKGADKLVDVFQEKGEMALLLVSQGGMAIQFALSEVPAMGRTTAGVRGMNLSVNDRVAFAIPSDLEGELALISDMGYMKRCLMVDFDPQARGGKGLKCFTFLKSNANGTFVAGAVLVKDPVNLVATQKGGTVSHVPSDAVKIDKRDGKGFPYVLVVLDDCIVSLQSEPL